MYDQLQLFDTDRHNIPAFESIWPGVITIVVLKKTSSLLLADGVKPEGVTLCARARLAKAAMSMEDVKCMSMLARRSNDWELM